MRLRFVLVATLGAVVGAAVAVIYQAPDRRVYCPGEVHDFGPSCTVLHHVTSTGVILGILVGAALFLVIALLNVGYNRKHLAE